MAQGWRKHLLLQRVENRNTLIHTKWWTEWEKNAVPVGISSPLLNPPSQQRWLLNITARYQKGNFSALTVSARYTQRKEAWCTQAGGKRGDVCDRGRREREREVGGLWREPMRRNIQRATAAWNRKPFKRKFTILLKNGHGRCVPHVSKLPCSEFLFPFMTKKRLKAQWSWQQPVVTEKGLSRGSVQLPMKYSLCNFICDNARPKKHCHRHNKSCGIIHSIHSAT